MTFRECYDAAMPEPQKIDLWAYFAVPTGDDIHPDERGPAEAGPHEPPLA